MQKPRQVKRQMDTEKCTARLETKIESSRWHWSAKLGGRKKVQEARLPALRLQVQCVSETPWWTSVCMFVCLYACVFVWNRPSSSRFPFPFGAQYTWCERSVRLILLKDPKTCGRHRKTLYGPPSWPRHWYSSEYKQLRCQYRNVILLMFDSLCSCSCYLERLVCPDNCF